jgi:predicted nuclease with TOPRIM domain
VGVHIAIAGSLMGIMWSYFIKAGDVTNISIDRMEDAARENAQDIKAALTRIDDYIYNHNEAIKRTEKDQTRIIEKLDKIETSVKDLQIDFGTLGKDNRK